MAEPHDRERNPDRTREAILDAAERLFADQGYDVTSLSQVGQAAGVSRGTPGYFFGSKADLYRAVLERCFGEVRRAVASCMGPRTRICRPFRGRVCHPGLVRRGSRARMGTDAR